MRLLHAVVFASLAASASFAGPLNPPAGPVTSTGRTTTEIEPRIPVGPTTTPGDATSLYIISQPGSYYLTGNLQGVSGKMGIRITADDVTLDLAGFEVLGVAGATVGIGNTSAPGRRGICIRNGNVTGWPTYGIQFLLTGGANAGHRFSDLTLRSNGIGLETRDAAICVNVSAISNTGNGFTFGDACVVQDCAAFANGNVGFNLGFGASATNCVARSNTSHGFAGYADCTLTACNAMLNGGDGFNVSNSTMSHCQSNNNTLNGYSCSSNTCIRDSSALGNTAGGILLATACRATDCHVSGGVFGIRATGSDNHIQGNSVRGATTGFDITASGNFIANNTASGGTTRYNVVAANTVGPIVSVSGTITSTSPYANFDY